MSIVKPLFHSGACSIKARQQGRIEYISFPESLKGKYQSFTQADTAKLCTIGGCDDGFMDLEAAVADYCRCLDQNKGYLA
jgi:ADP-L-glycero-D-manno-heptose 6-epimerase